MGLFNWLPKVYRFCWCTKNFKCAFFVIIFLGMFTSIHTAGLLAKPACQELFNISSPIRLSADVFRWILFVLEMFLATSCFVFMLGIFLSLPVTADILIGCALLTCIVSIVYTVLMIMQEQYTDCRWYYTQAFHLILYVIMWSYFVLIISTYEDDM